MIEAQHIFLFHDSRAETQGSIPLSHSLLIFSTAAVNSCEKLSTNDKNSSLGLTLGKAISPYEKGTSLWHLQPAALASFSLIHKVKNPVNFKSFANELHCLCPIFKPRAECRPLHHGEMTLKIILCCTGIGMVPQGKAKNPLPSTSKKFTVVKGIEGEKGMQKFAGKLGQRTGLSVGLRWTPPKQ